MVGTVLRLYRRSNHLSQKEMAAALGITREYYCRLEGGFGTPSFPLFEKMCSTMGLASVQVAGNTYKGSTNKDLLRMCELCARLSKEDRNEIQKLMDRLLTK
jgi:transcriptional regulator with XRE-family HTH domain